MYNAELKEEFVKQFTDSITTRNACLTLFNKFEPYEVMWNADLCTQEAEVLTPIINNLIGLRVRSKNNRMSILVNYGQWCLDNNVSGACNGLLNVKPDNLENVRHQTVKNPKHLQRYLNEICLPESMQSADNTIRCFYWLAYAGMNEDDIFSVKTTDVNLDEMEVVYNGESYNIYREGLDAIKNCVKLNQFVYINPNYSADKIVYINRVPGDILIRGIKGTLSKQTMRVVLSRKSKECLKPDKITGKPKTDLKLSYYRVWLSGVFYRMYENELAGDKPDFKSLADSTSANKEYKLSSGRNTQESKRRKLAHEFATDYQRWKMTLSQ